MCALQRYLNSLTDAGRSRSLKTKVGYEYVRGNQKPPHYNPRFRKAATYMLRALIRLTELSRSWQTKCSGSRTFAGIMPSSGAILRNQPKF